MVTACARYDGKQNLIFCYTFYDEFEQFVKKSVYTGSAYY